MGKSKQKNPTTRFLMRSFIGLLIFSIIVFSLLGIYMSRKSEKAVYEIGEIYMSGMNQQMSRHFETVIKLRFSQVSGIVSVVSTDNVDEEKLYEELIYRAQVRGFDYLALCSPEGDFQTLYGESIQPINPEPFVEALLYLYWRSRCDSACGSTRTERKSSVTYSRTLHCLPQN